MNKLFEEMKRYYAKMEGGPGFAPLDAPYQELTAEVTAMIIQEEQEHPEWSAVMLKARQHEMIAERFEPVIFPHSPFYFEMGITPARNWGTPNAKTPGSSLHQHRFHLFWDGHPEAWAEHDTRSKFKLENINPCPIDPDHHCFNYTRVLEVGLQGLMEEAESEMTRCNNDEEKSFIHAAMMSLNAVRNIAMKFADKAQQMLDEAEDDDAKKCLKMIAVTAPEVPWRPPRTFYEGLACLWFLREVCGSLEGLGVSVLGHPDRQLIKLYRDDLAADRITASEAEDLISRWMLPTDCRFDLDNNPWPETSATLILGGCDRDGKPVFNELTTMFIEQHHRLNLVNPKLNCRYGSYSPPEYLNLISEKVLSGHNVFALLNDDILIPANVKSGKRVEDCRCYGAGGCQETVVEGVEHSAGAYYYFNMPWVFALLMNPPTESKPLLDIYPERNNNLENISDFESFYSRVKTWISYYLRRGAENRARRGENWSRVNPAPFFSAALYDCLTNHRDYTAGGGRYNVGGITLCGFGTLIDALLAVKKLCFDDKELTLTELSDVLKSDWQGFEELRARAIAAPKFGHGSTEVEHFVARVAADLAQMPKGLVNERGGHFQMSFFVYYEYVWMAAQTPATPDGRHDGELFTQGVSPGRLQPVDELTTAVNSLREIDFSNYPGNAVLDLQLPMGKMSAEHLSSVIYSAGKAGIPTLQFNCVDIETLKKAQLEPENYKDLTVRISGLSARFVALMPEVQDEIIHRNMFG